MRKIFLSISLFLIILNLIIPVAYAESVDITLHDVECLENGQVRIRYGLINNKGFDENNVILGFQIIVGDKPVACKELKVDVSKGSDGSDVMELFIKASCKPNSFEVKYISVAYPYKRYAIDEWFSGCQK